MNFNELPHPTQNRMQEHQLPDFAVQLVSLPEDIVYLNSYQPFDNLQLKNVYQPNPMRYYAPAKCGQFNIFHHVEPYEEEDKINFQQKSCDANYDTIIESINLLTQKKIEQKQQLERIQQQQQYAKEIVSQSYQLQQNITYEDANKRIMSEVRQDNEQPRLNYYNQMPQIQQATVPSNAGNSAGNLKQDSQDAVIFGQTRDVLMGAFKSYSQELKSQLKIQQQQQQQQYNQYNQQQQQEYNQQHIHQQNQYDQQQNNPNYNQIFNRNQQQIQPEITSSQIDIPTDQQYVQSSQSQMYQQPGVYNQNQQNIVKHQQDDFNIDLDYNQINAPAPHLVEQIPQISNPYQKQNNQHLQFQNQSNFAIQQQFNPNSIQNQVNNYQNSVNSNQQINQKQKEIIIPPHPTSIQNPPTIPDQSSSSIISSNIDHFQNQYQQQNITVQKQPQNYNQYANTNNQPNKQQNYNQIVNTQISDEFMVDSQVPVQLTENNQPSPTNESDALRQPQNKSNFQQVNTDFLDQEPDNEYKVTQDPPKQYERPPSVVQQTKEQEIIRRALAGEDSDTSDNFDINSKVNVQDSAGSGNDLKKPKQIKKKTKVPPKQIQQQNQFDSSISDSFTNKLNTIGKKKPVQHATGVKDNDMFSDD